MALQNCWEFKQCGRQRGGPKVRELGVCPAAKTRAADGLNGGTNAGRICWAVSGTFCGGEVQGSFAHKRLNCMTCDFFAVTKQEAGRAFRLLLPGQVYQPPQR